MKYELLAEEEIIIPGFYHEVKEPADIRRIRTILLAILAFKLILSLIYMAIKVFYLITDNPSPDHPTHDSLVTAALVVGFVVGALLTVYLAIFLIFVVTNKRTGILVCALLSAIDLILTIIVVILAIVALVTAATSSETVIGLGLGASIVVVIGSSIATVLTFLTIVFSFELARLIKLQQDNRLD